METMLDFNEVLDILAETGWIADDEEGGYGTFIHKLRDNYRLAFACGTDMDESCPYVEISEAGVPRAVYLHLELAASEDGLADLRDALADFEERYIR